MSGKTNDKGKLKMRFLSIAACALAASLLSASPSQAVIVESHYLTGPHSFTIYGEIPEPVNISVGYHIDLTFSEGFSGSSGYGIVVNAWTDHSWIQVGEIKSPSGMHYPAPWDPRFVTISDTARTISISIQAEAIGYYVMTDASAYFYLPDNLSIAAPVPEASTWAMLLLGFAGIGFLAYRRRNQFSPACYGTLPPAPGCAPAACIPPRR
jgi:hypothetical protein